MLGAAIAVVGIILIVVHVTLAFYALFFFAYFFHPFERPEEVRLRPFTQNADVRTLEKGEPANIIDSWRLRISKEPAMHIVHQVEAAEVDPQARIFSVRVQTRKSTEALASDRAAQLKFFRSVLDFLFCLIDEEWLRPYRNFYQTVELEVWGEHLDEIARPIPYRFYRIAASVQKVEEIMKTGWDPFQLDKIFDVTFDSWKEI